jgi:hypothetical protein
MNERIKQLAEQAGHRYYPSSNSGPLRVEYLTPELEKFAELLIKETLQIARVGMEFGPSMDEAVYTYFDIDSDEIEYCPKCNAEWSGTSCGLDDCGWIGGEE